MLYSIVGYVTKDFSGVSWAHITYVGQDGNLHDLVRRQGASQWSYGANITASVNALVNAANNLPTNEGWIPAPVAVGNIGVSVISTGISSELGAIIIYYGADDAIHAIYPVSEGFYWRGTPGAPDTSDDSPDQPDYPNPPDVGDDDFGDGPDLSGGGDPSVAPSSPGYSDTLIVQTAGQPPLAVYTNTDMPENPVITVIYQEGSVFAVKGYGSTWPLSPVNISRLANNSGFGPDASAVYWPDDGTEHVFCVNLYGLLEEFWSHASKDQTAWGAHDVLHEIKQLVPPPPGVDTMFPMAPKAVPGSPTVAFLSPDSTKNVVYIDADGIQVHLCSHDLSGVWRITDISASAISPSPQKKVGTLEYLINQQTPMLGWASDRIHVLYTSQETIVDIWSGSGGEWYWGLPNTFVPGTSSGEPEDYAFNVATGMSSFVWDVEDTDYLIFINQEGHISELSLKHGSSAPQQGLSNGLPWKYTNVSAQVGSAAGYVPPTLG